MYMHSLILTLITTEILAPIIKQKKQLYMYHLVSIAFFIVEGMRYQVPEVSTLYYLLIRTQVDLLALQENRLKVTFHFLSSK